MSKVTDFMGMETTRTERTPLEVALKRINKARVKYDLCQQIQSLVEILMDEETSPTDRELVMIQLQVIACGYEEIEGVYA